MDETRWLTYDGLAEALGINPDSARRLVARRRWPKKPGNDGRALIAVPLERLPSDNPPDRDPDTREDVSPDVIPVVPPDAPDTLPFVHALQARVTKLEAELQIARKRSDDLLAAVAEAERRHAAEIRADRDAWRTQADRLAARSWLPWRRSA